MKPLTDKQVGNKLDNHYKEFFGIRDTDNWYVNPAPNIWKFERDGKIIILICNKETGKVTERQC
jgi:hypothetical protein